MWGKIIKILFIINLLFLNFSLGYLLYKDFSGTLALPETYSEHATEEGLGLTPKTDDSSCPIGCVDYINSNIQKSPDVIISPTLAPTPSSTIRLPISVSSPKVKSASYLPIPGSGSTLSTEWVEVAGSDFYMSTADYPGLVGVYFEANMRLQNGNGKAYARIYDDTHNRGVDGSEISTKSQTSEFVSNGPISLWSGFNHYKIQIKSLTADTTHFETGKLKIVTEN